MYAGQVMEQADRRELFYDSIIRTPKACSSRCPPTAASASGCAPIAVSRRARSACRPAARSRPRCPYGMERCSAEQPAARPGGRGAGHRSACWLPRNPAARQALRARWRTTTARSSRGSVRGRDDTPRLASADRARRSRPRRRAAAAGGRGQALPGPVDRAGPRAARSCTRSTTSASRYRRGRDARPGRRDRLRQVDAGPCVARLYDLTSRHDRLRRPGHHRALPAAPCGRSGARCR